MKFWDNWVRGMFCRKELKEGRMLVLWKDVDGEVSGWGMKADEEEVALASIALMVRSAKKTKLKNILEGSGK